MSRFPNQNYETIAIQAFIPELPSAKPETKGAAILNTITLGIPCNSGDYAEAAMIVGFCEHFYQKVIGEMEPEVKELYERAQARLASMQPEKKIIQG